MDSNTDAETQRLMNQLRSKYQGMANARDDPVLAAGQDNAIDEYSLELAQKQLDEIYRKGDELDTREGIELAETSEASTMKGKDRGASNMLICQGCKGAGIITTMYNFREMQRECEHCMGDGAVHKSTLAARAAATAAPEPSTSGTGEDGDGDVPPLETVNPAQEAQERREAAGHVPARFDAAQIAARNPETRTKLKARQANLEKSLVSIEQQMARYHKEAVAVRVERDACEAGERRGVLEELLGQLDAQIAKLAEEKGARQAKLSGIKFTLGGSGS